MASVIDTLIQMANYADPVNKLLDQIGTLSGLETTKLAAGAQKMLRSNKALMEQYVAFTQATTELESRNNMLNKSFSISYETAGKLSQEFHKVGKEIGLTGDQVKQYGANLKKIIPTYNQMRGATSAQFKGLLSIQKVLTTNLGLSEQVAQEYIGLAAAQGDAGDNFAQTLQATAKLVEELDPSGEMGYFQQIGEQLGKAGASVTLQFGKIPGQLELAALKANQLGLELTQLKTVGDKLLNIESSIGDELEYQLLSGRRLVGNDQARNDLQGKSLTNAYRMAMMQGDMNKQADILNTILAQEGGTLENNMFARQKMADLLGMEESALSGAIQKRKILERLKKEGGIDLFEKQGEDLIQGARAAFQQGSMTKEDFEKLTKIADTRTSDDILKDQLQRQEEIAYATLYTAQQAEIIAQSAANNAGYAKDLLAIGQTTNSKTIIDDFLKGLGEKYLTDKKKSSADTLNAVAGADTGGTITTNVNTGGSSLDDGVIINPAARIDDGIIQTHPKDKFLKVNDAVTVVGTKEAGNQALANQLGASSAAMTNDQVNQLIQAFQSVGMMLKTENEKLRTQIKQDRLFAPGLNASTWG